MTCFFYKEDFMKKTNKTLNYHYLQNIHNPPPHRIQTLHIISKLYGVLINDKYNTLYNREGKVSLLYNLTPCSKCQPLQVMQPLRGYDDLYTHAYHKFCLTSTH